MFSERYGFKEKEILQKAGMSTKLKTDIWNSLVKYFFNKVYCVYDNNPHSAYTLQNCSSKNYVYALYEDFLYISIDKIENEPLYEIKKKLSKFYDGFQWYEVYDFVEFVDSVICNVKFEEEINTKLERNNAAYRMVKGIVIPITNELELLEIKQAASTKFDEVSGHIEKAIQLFSNRKSADYENTIKESITAVEAMCSIITNKHDSLGDTLKLLEKKGLYIHPALKSSFNTLFGYTSNGNGIRHAGDLGSPNSTFSEAKFMLVSCSAFVNYLIENSKGFI